LKDASARARSSKKAKGDAAAQAAARRLASEAWINDSSTGIKLCLMGVFSCFAPIVFKQQSF
jgi:hypothetical protein